MTRSLAHLARFAAVRGIVLAVTVPSAWGAEDPLDAVARHVDAARSPWVATYGGSGADFSTAVAATPDGGAYVAGRTTSFGAGATDAWLARVGRRGETRFELVLGGSARDELHALAVTPDGGCLAVGSTDSFGAGGSDGWLLKVSAQGEIDWQLTYGDVGDDSLVAVDLSSNGAYVGGTFTDARTGADAWILEVGLDGSVLWQERFSGAGFDGVSAITATPEGPVFAALSNTPLSASEPSIPFFRPWLVSLDTAGAVRWQRSYNVSGGDAWSDLQALPDGGFIATGEALAMAFNRGDVWVVRLDGSGNILWDRRFGDHFQNYWVDAGVAVRPRRGGGFLVAASTGTSTGGGNEDLWLIGLDALGNLEWDRVYGDASFDGAGGLDVGPGGSVFLSGFVAGDALLMKLLPGGRTGAGCGVTKPTDPNTWTSALTEAAGVIPPAATSVVPAETAASEAMVGTRVWVCPPR